MNFNPFHNSVWFEKDKVRKMSTTKIKIARPWTIHYWLTLRSTNDDNHHPSCLIIFDIALLYGKFSPLGT